MFRLIAAWFIPVYVFGMAAYFPHLPRVQKFSPMGLANCPPSTRWSYKKYPSIFNVRTQVILPFLCLVLIITCQVFDAHPAQYHPGYLHLLARDPHAGRVQLVQCLESRVGQAGALDPALLRQVACQMLLRMLHLGVWSNFDHVD